MKNPYASMILGFVIGIMLIMYLSDHRPNAKVIYRNEPVSCERSYTNSRGQTICIPDFPDSVYRK